MGKNTLTSPNQRLRHEREQHGWSQEDVARKIGAPDDKTVHRWESGKVFPGPHYRQMLCSLYDKSAEELGLIPAAPLPVWNVPYRRNPFFTGREDVLQRLSDAFTTGKRVVLTQIISGLGGIGKTQIAVEYAYRHRDEYQFILWVRAATPDLPLTDFAAFASLIYLPENVEQDQQKVVVAVIHWLENHTSWLLVLDNAEDFDMITNFLPNSGSGHILVTTRAHSTGSIASGIELKIMDKEESILLLLRRAKILASDASLDQSTLEDRARAEVIVQMMGGLPLALDQAAAYIEETGCGLAGYPLVYSNRRKELLQRRSTFPSDHPASVATTWSLSFQEVEQTNPAAADLLRLGAFLAPDAIPEEIITLGVDDLGPLLGPIATDPFALNDAFETLQKYSLVRRYPDENMFSIHRLVQAVLKENMDYSSQRIWAERTVQAVNHVFPTAEFATWIQCQRLLPHAQVCAALIEQWAMAFPEVTRLLRRTGYYLFERARYGEAEPLYQHALAFNEKTLGPEHPETATSLNDLAQLYQARGQYDLAEPLYQRALLIREKVLGLEHPETAATLNDQAQLYQVLGNFAQVEPLYQRALAIRIKVLGPEHPTTATSLHALAELYRGQSKFTQAEPLYLQALLIREKLLGPEHPTTASTLRDLARLYQAQSRYDLAEPLYQRSLAIFERVLGAEHPYTISTLENYADLLREA
jgi:tetratricopeptide (TPR) repeat protein/transcriptional regulator with XRE-family HTH domain